MLLVWLALAWMVGIFITDMVAPPPTLLAGLLLAGLLLAGLAGRMRTLRLAGLCLLCAALGGLRYQMVHAPPSPQCVCHLVETGSVAVRGSIAADPQRTEEGQRVVLQAQAARLEDASGQAVLREQEGLLLLNLPPYPTYHYGQQLVVTGEVQQPPAARRPNTFDYREYLARKNIFALMDEPLVQVVPGTAGNWLVMRLFRFRDASQRVLLRLLPEPQASIAAGLLLGLKNSIPDTVRQEFARTGIAHLIVISGWHLSLVAALIGGIAAQMRLGRGMTFWVALVALWSYALFVGATATVIRAAIMGSLVVLATATERRTQPWILLLVACWGMTLSNPQTLWDLGFQLSVLATASLFAFATPVERWLRRWSLLRWPPLHSFTTTLTATLAVQVLILPIILYHFGNLSVVAPLTNVLVAPVVPVAMVTGSIALVAGWLWLPLGQVVAAVLAWLPLAYITGVTHWLATMRWSAVQFPPLPLWVVIGYYAIVAVWWVAAPTTPTEQEQTAQPHRAQRGNG
jgi:competence protein ComEC